MVIPFFTFNQELEQMTQLERGGSPNSKGAFVMQKLISNTLPTLIGVVPYSFVVDNHLYSGRGREVWCQRNRKVVTSHW